MARLRSGQLYARTDYAVRSSFRRRADIIVLGGYHGENTGDWAMGEVLHAYARRSNRRAIRIKMSDIRRLAGNLPVIVGGGAVGTAETLAPLATLWQRHRFPLAIVGVEFSQDFTSYPPSIREMCGSARGVRRVSSPNDVATRTFGLTQI